MVADCVAVEVVENVTVGVADEVDVLDEVTVLLAVLVTDQVESVSEELGLGVGVTDLVMVTVAETV